MSTLLEQYLNGTTTITEIMTMDYNVHEAIYREMEKSYHTFKGKDLKKVDDLVDAIDQRYA